MSKTTEKKERKKKGFRIGGLFYNNKFVMAFSLLAALILWFFMAFNNTENFPVVIRDVPVTIQLPESAQSTGLKVFTPTEQKVTVYLKGNSLSVRSIKAEDIEVTTQVQQAVSGSGSYLATLNVRFKGYVTDVEIDNVEPSILTLDVDYSAEKSFPISCTGVTASTEEDYFISESTSSPDSVTISGPKTAVDNISKVITDEIDLGTIQESKKFTSNLTLLDANGNKIEDDRLTLSVEKTEVTVPVLLRKSVPFVVNFTNQPTGLVLGADAVKISPSQIELAGTKELFDANRAINLDPVDFSSISPENNTFEVPISLPSGFKNLRSVNSVQVTLNLEGYITKRLVVSNFKMNNVESGYTASVLSDSVTIIVVGPEDQLEDLTADNIIGQVDLSGKEVAGHTEAPVSFGISGGTKCWAYGVYTVNVSLQKQ